MIWFIGALFTIAFEISRSETWSTSTLIERIAGVFFCIVICFVLWPVILGIALGEKFNAE